MTLVRCLHMTYFEINFINAWVVLTLHEKVWHEKGLIDNTKFRKVSVKHL